MLGYKTTGLYFDKDCNTLSINECPSISLASAACSTAGHCSLPFLLFPAFQKEPCKLCAVEQGMLRRYLEQSLQHVWTLWGGEACWPSERWLLLACFVAAHAGVNFWTDDWISGSGRAKASPSRMTFTGIFAGDVLTVFCPQCASCWYSCSLGRLPIPWLWGKREGSMISPTFWRG